MNKNSASAEFFTSGQRHGPRQREQLDSDKELDIILDSDLDLILDPDLDRGSDKDLHSENDLKFFVAGARHSVHHLP